MLSLSAAYTLPGAAHFLGILAAYNRSPMKYLRNALGPSWRPRTLLAVAAAVLLIVTILRGLLELETSLTIATTAATPTATITPGGSPTASPVGALATPTVALTPTVTPASGGALIATETQVATTTPTAAAALASLTSATAPGVTTTSVKTTGSDTLELGFLGLAALFLLVAVFYDRLTEISGPGGIGIKLSTEQQSNMSEAVAQVGGERTRKRAALTPDVIRQQLQQSGNPPPFHLAMMARIDQTQSLDDVVRVTQETIDTGGKATILATSYAETLLRLAASSPDSLRALARAWDIPDEELGTLVVGRIGDRLRRRLAARALDEVGVPDPLAAQTERVHGLGDPGF